MWALSQAVRLKIAISDILNRIIYCVISEHVYVYIYIYIYITNVASGLITQRDDRPSTKVVR